MEREHLTLTGSLRHHALMAIPCYGKPPSAGVITHWDSPEFHHSTCACWVERWPPILGLIQDPVAGTRYVPDLRTMSVKDSGSNGSSTEFKNDISRVYSVQGDLSSMVSRWESELQDLGQMGSKVSGGGFTGEFTSGHHVAGEVVITKRFTVPMDIPAYLIQQMIEDFEDYGASVDIDMSTSVTGRPPKQKESGVVVPRGPSQEKIDAMDESEKLHTGVVEVTMDITDQMQGVPDGEIIEGSRCSHLNLGVVFVKGIHGSDPDHVYVVPEDQDQIKGRVASVDPGSLDLLEQFPEETEESAWWNDF